MHAVTQSFIATYPGLTDADRDGVEAAARALDARVADVEGATLDEVRQIARDAGGLCVSTGNGARYTWLPGVRRACAARERALLVGRADTPHVTVDATRLL